MVLWDRFHAGWLYQANGARPEPVSVGYYKGKRLAASYPVLEDPVTTPRITLLFGSVMGRQRWRHYYKRIVSLTAKGSPVRLNIFLFGLGERIDDAIDNVIDRLREESKRPQNPADE